MRSTTRMNRRGFLKGAGTAALLGPYVITSTALGAPGRPPASGRIGTASIGVGGRGGSLLKGLLGDGDVQVLAACDVDPNRLQAAKQTIDQRYSADAPGTYAGCTTYSDFLELLQRTDIDGVVIATPDHWHGLMTVHAAKAGKDVYCEKPMASTIGDGRASADALKKYGRVFQTGSHERSTASTRYACELVRNGRLGKIHTIRTFLPTEFKSSKTTGPMPIPEGFDYDRWLGPAPWEPYHPARCHGSFRWILDYSDGELTDRGAHVNDIALLGAGPLLGGTVEITARGKCFDDPLFNVPYEFNIAYRFANGLQILTESRGNPDPRVQRAGAGGAAPPGDPKPGQGKRGIRFEGERGWVFVEIHGGALSADPPSLLRETIGPGDIHLGRSPGHAQDWIQAIKTRGPTMAPAEDGHRTASFCHLGLIAMQLERKLVWDWANERFLNDAEANRMIHRPLRAPWKF